MADPPTLSRRTLLRGGSALAVGAAVAGSGALVACEPVRKVFVIGDSLTVGAEAVGLGTDDADGTIEWTVVAKTNRTTNSGTAIVADRDLSGHWMVIVALGTNDFLDPTAVFAARIDKMMAAIGPHPRVRWVNVDAGASKLASAADGVNVALAAAPSRHPALRIADWDAHLRSLPSTAGLRASDGVHYTAAGYRVRRSFTESIAS